jgi:hypothetical protein
MPEPVEIPVAFVQALRQAGLAVPTDAALTYAQALAEVGLDRPARVYWSGRATLVRRPEDVVVYDQVFAAFFGHPEGPAPSPPDDGQDPPLIEGAYTVRWSPTEVLRHKDLAACTPDEMDEAHRLISTMRVKAAMRRSRRRRANRHGRGRPDLRLTLQRALRTGGEVVRPATTRPRQRPRRLVLLVDVSGSMEPYARALTRFAHAAVAARRRGQVEIFALGTRVTRITRELSTHDPDRALAQASTAVVDWAGGTRLGEGIGRFNDRWAVRGLARGALVVILSDGWDRGDPEQLAVEVARLGRVAHRIIWVNPLKASAGYAPLVRGMAAALPLVDDFVEGHSVASLEALAELVSR